MTISLFPDDLEFIPANWVPLDKDSTTWPMEITTMVKNILPAEAADITIKWNTKEDGKGYALGSVIVIPQSSRQKFVIPIIIKDFELAPLDTMLTPNRALQLTNKNIEDMFFTSDVAAGVVSERDNDLLGHSEVDKNERGHLGEGYAPASYTYQKSSSLNMVDLWDNLNKQGALEKFSYAIESDQSLCADLKETIQYDDAKRVLNELKNPSVFNKFAGKTKKLFVDFVEGVKENKEKANKKDNEKVKDKEGTEQIEAIKKVGPNAYVVMSNSIENFEEILGSTDGANIRVKLKEQLGNDEVVDAVLESVEYNGEEGTLVPNEKKDDSQIELKTKDDSYGIYNAYNPQGGSIVTGVLFRDVTDDGKKIKSKKIFVSHSDGGEQDSSFKPYKSSYNKGQEYRVLDLKDYATQGKKGYFVINELLVGPCFVLSSELNNDAMMGKFANYRVKIDGMDDVVNIIHKYTPRNRVGSHDLGREFVNKTTDLPWGKDSDGEKNWHFACDAKWLPIDKDIQFTTTQPKSTSSIEKSSQYYILDGFDYDTHKFPYVKEAELKFILANNGLSIEKVAQVIDLVNTNRRVELTNVPGKPRPQQKQAGIGKKALEIVNFDPQKYDLVKVAAEIERMETVDKVLGLNFINEANVFRFLSSLPSLQQAMDELNRLLIVVRLGLNDVSESAVKQAVEALSDVIEGLRRLETKYRDEA